MKQTHSKHLLLIGLAILIAACQGGSKEKNDLVELKGPTMGTTYQVTYKDPDQVNWSRSIDSLLVVVNNSMSTYIPTSLISVLNNTDSAFTMNVDAHFFRVFKAAKTIHQKSGGAMNPAVMPLIEYWGFGPGDAPEHIDSAKVDSLLQHTRFDSFTGAMMVVPNQGGGDTTYQITKKDPQAMLDFSAIAKGYGVDVLGEWLERHGYSDYFVEIGGEVRAKGTDDTGKPWLIGLEDPLHSALNDRKATALVHLGNGAIATSGNYRNIREIDGVKYSHTFNPVTGYPELNNLLSASVYTSDCMHADGYATACMVLGLEGARNMIERIEGLEAYLIYTDSSGEIQTWASEGMKPMMVEN